jgi:hypothetical protein
MTRMHKGNNNGKGTAVRQLVSWCGLMLGMFFCSPAWGDQSVSLAWNPSPDTNVVGYVLYYGTSSSNYTTRVDMGTNTSATINGLKNPGANYFFAATAYNSSQLESVPSNEATFTTSTNAGPTLATVADRSLNVMGFMTITNTATDPGLPQKQITFSLDPGAPADMRINPVNGLVLWVPKLSAGGTTNHITVRATDNNVPPLYSLQTFTIVVSNAAQITLGPSIVGLGQTGMVQVVSASSVAVTNMTFVLDVPSDRATNVTVQTLTPSIAVVSQQPAGAAHSVITIQAVAGQAWQGTQAVAQIVYKAVAGKPSAFGLSTASAVTAIQADGQTVPRRFGSSGKLVFVGAEPLVESSVSTNGQRSLVLYGPAGSSSHLESAATATGQGGWTSEFSTTLTSSLFQTFQPANTGSVKFYRAHNP